MRLRADLGEGRPVRAHLAPVAVLYAMPGSVYHQLAEDVYDERRDARTFAGGLPVVAHPPCRTWSVLRAFAKAPAGEELCAAHAVAMVRACGGVLEHPHGSALWARWGLPLPGSGRDLAGGWSTCVDQVWFGHRAQKRTWLYVVGVEPAHVRVPLRFDPPRVPVQLMGQGERLRTPPAFATWLLDLAQRVRR